MGNNPNSIHNLVMHIAANIIFLFISDNLNYKQAYFKNENTYLLI